MLDSLLGQMTQRDATDLYLTVGSPPIMSAGGDFRRIGTDDLTTADVEGILAGTVAAEGLERFRQERELNVALEGADGDRFRLNAFRQRGQTGIVIRRIRSEIPSMPSLGLPAIVAELAMLKRGLVLVTGATGSGKSTTLASIIDYRNQHAFGHIVTIEDPIEFVHSHKRSLVSQREVGVDTHSFRQALHNALRQAPTVLLLGELRDEETVQAALRFAETGHLVFATLHATNAAQAIERIVTVHAEHLERQVLLQLSLNMKGILSQRLVQRRDLAGRAAAIEVLLNTARVADLIRKGQIEDLRESMAAGSGEGMQTFDQALLHLHRSGVISADDAIANADSPNDVRLKIRVEAIDDGAAESGADEIRIEGVPARRSGR